MNNFKELFEADMTKYYDGFEIKNNLTGKLTRHKYIKGKNNTKVERAAMEKLAQELKVSVKEFSHWGFIQKGEW